MAVELDRTGGHGDAVTNDNPEPHEDARMDITVGRDAYVAGRDSNIYRIRNIHKTRNYYGGLGAQGSAGRRTKSRLVILGIFGLAVMVVGGTGVYYATLPRPHEGGRSSTTRNPPSASGGGANPSGRRRGVAAEQWPDFLIPGTVVMCQQEANAAEGTDVTLSAISVTTGQTVASRTFSLPSWASAGFSCFGDGLTSASPVRQMFNRSFTSMAVTESLTDGEFATVMNLQNEQVASVPTPSGFTSQPQQADPQFDPATQEVWYADSASSQIGVFDPASGDDTVKGQSDGTEVAVGNGSYWPVDGYNWAVSPDGQHIAIADDNVQLAMYFAHAGVAVSNGAGGINTTNPDVEVFAGDSDGTTVLPGSDKVDCQAPAAWVDNTHLLCYEQDISGTNIGLVTFVPGGNSVAGFQGNLLQQTSRTNGSLVVSPDGKSFAFLSLDGTTLIMYRESLAPHSSPVKITVISTDADPEDFPFLLQWN